MINLPGTIVENAERALQIGRGCGGKIGQEVGSIAGVIISVGTVGLMAPTMALGPLTIAAVGSGSSGFLAGRYLGRLAGAWGAKKAAKEAFEQNSNITEGALRDVVKHQGFLTVVLFSFAIALVPLAASALQSYYNSSKSPAQEEQLSQINASTGKEESLENIWEGLSSSEQLPEKEKALETPIKPLFNNEEPTDLAGNDTVFCEYEEVPNP